MKRHTLLLLVVVLVLVGIATFGIVNHLESVVQLAFADEQTEMFQAMVARAADALAKSQPDPREAVQYLAYAHSYYPSGTKQVQGSRLDNIVERSRSLAELRIIDMLRKATGEDHGDDAEAWIQTVRSARINARDETSPVSQPR